MVEAVDVVVVVVVALVVVVAVVAVVLKIIKVLLTFLTPVRSPTLVLKNVILFFLSFCFLPKLLWLVLSKSNQIK
jgi:hypothetical protein